MFGQVVRHCNEKLDGLRSKRFRLIKSSSWYLPALELTGFCDLKLLFSHSSKVCLPYLKTAQNPHILNITVQLNMRHDWFKDNIG